MTPCGTPATRLARRMGNGTMRIFIAVGLVTVGIFAAAGSLAPIAAQEGATAANPYNLPPTHFGSENPQAVHAFDVAPRSEEHTSELKSLMRNSYAVFCLKKTTTHSTIYS